MNPLHSPLGLRARLRPPQTPPVAASLVAVLLLAILLTFAGSRHIFAPGVAVALRESAETSGPTTLTLPRSPTPLPGERTDATLTIPAPNPALLTAYSNTMVFFEGRMYPLKDSGLRAAMAHTVRESGEKNPALLLKMDGSVSMNRFYQLRAYAEEAGFTRIIIAGEDSRSAPPPKGTPK